MGKFAEAVAARLAEEAEKPEGAIVEPSQETATDTEVVPEVVVAETAPAQAEQPQAQPARTEQPAPAADMGAEQRRTTGPLAALKAERVQRQMAERELQSLRQELEAIKRAPAPAAPQAAARAEETVDELIERYAREGEELPAMTAKEVAALRQELGEVKQALVETQNWRGEIQARQQDAEFEAWLADFKQHVPGMPENLILRSLTAKATPSDIVADWHEYLEAHPNAALGQPAPAQRTNSPSRPATPPPPRIAAPSSPLATQGTVSKKDVFARMQAELSE